MVERALVVGATGQDGRFLCRHLATRGVTVFGVGGRPEHPDGLVGYRSVDLSRPHALRQVLDEVRPDLVFHVAAVHGSAGFSYEAVWDRVLAVNVGSLHDILEYARVAAPRTFVVYAGSAKIFGSRLAGRIDHATPPAPDCLYGITKHAALQLLGYYRRVHGVAGSVLHLFNHESEFRPANYFIPRLTAAVAQALAGQATPLHTLDFYCDWGLAEEYMEIAVDIALQRLSEDFVLASGETWLGRDLAERLFLAYGLDYRKYLSEQAPGSPGAFFQIDLALLNERLGRTPRRSILDLCSMLVDRQRAIPAEG